MSHIIFSNKVMQIAGHLKMSSPCLYMLHVSYYILCHLTRVNLNLKGSNLKIRTKFRRSTNKVSSVFFLNLKEYILEENH